MRLEGLQPGVKLITMSGDVVELIEVIAGGESARVRYTDVLGGAAVAADSEATVTAQEIITIDGERFIGPERTASSSGQ